MKICTKCKKEGEFFLDKKSKDGLQSQCKKCKTEYICAYYKLNKEKRFKKSKEQLREIYHKNKFARNISRRIRQSLVGLRKSKSWQHLVDYSLRELKQHLKLKFREGTSWENYGEWHIDHIKPVSSFNITSDSCDEFKQCWKLDNLQPLWKKENFMKSNKY